MRVTPRFKKFLLIVIVAICVIVALIWVFPHFGRESGKEEDFIEAAKTPVPGEDLDVSGIDLTGKKIIVDAGH